MTDAKLGLLVTAPLLVGFAVMLHRMGALQRTGTILAATATIVIAAILFTAQ